MSPAAEIMKSLFLISNVLENIIFTSTVVAPVSQSKVDCLCQSEKHPEAKGEDTTYFENSPGVQKDMTM